MPRLFAALKVPASLSLQLTELRGGLNGARWIDPENYHVTLRFYGDIDRHKANDLALALSNVERHTMDLCVDRLDAFGNAKPRNLHAAIRQSPELMELQGEIERIAQRLRLKTEKRKYCPHITLARLSGTTPDEVARFIASRGGFSSLPFEVSSFELLSSKDSIGGGPYQVEERYDLLDPPNAGWSEADELRFAGLATAW